MTKDNSAIFEVAFLGDFLHFMARIAVKLEGPLLAPIGVCLQGLLNIFAAWNGGLREPMWRSRGLLRGQTVINGISESLGWRVSLASDSKFQNADTVKRPMSVCVNATILPKV